MNGIKKRPQCLNAYMPKCPNAQMPCSMLVTSHESEDWMDHGALLAISTAMSVRAVQDCSSSYGSRANECSVTSARVL